MSNLSLSLSIYISSGFQGQGPKETTHVSPMVDQYRFGRFIRFWTWIDASTSLFGLSGIHQIGLGCQKTHPRSSVVNFTSMFECKFVICMLWLDILCISSISRVWKRRGTLFRVDLSKKFGLSSVLELFDESNNVL